MLACRTMCKRLHSFKSHYASFFFFIHTATTEIYTLSLHDALPIWIVLCPAAKHLNDAFDFIAPANEIDRKSTRLNSSHRTISYAVFCLKKKKNQHFSKRAPTESCKRELGIIWNTPPINLIMVIHDE